MLLLLALALSASPPLEAAAKHLKAGQLDELAFDLGDAAKLAPADQAEAARLLAEGAVQAQKKGDPVLTLQLAQTAHRRDPHNLDALRTLGELALADQAFGEAEGYADAWVNLAPSDAHAALLRARIAAAEEDWDKAATLSELLVGNGALTAAEQKQAEAVHQKAAAAVQAQQQAEAAETARAERFHAAAEVAAKHREEDFAQRDRPRAAHHGTIIMYGTWWCNFCKKARAYFKQHDLAYVEKDVEKDHAAAAEMQAKARQAGFDPSGVPILDVNGHILQGFNADDVEWALSLDGD